MSTTILLVLAAVASASAKPQETPGAVPPSVDPSASCATCHADVVASRGAAKDVHDDLGCADCHPGRPFNPHVAPELDAETAKLAEGFAPVAAHSPAAYTACSQCHEDEVAAVHVSVHGDGTDKPNTKKPSCADCHGTIHNVTAASMDKRAIASRCIDCHSFSSPGKDAVHPYVVDTYRDTVHGKMLAIGNTRAAACADCHTGHSVLGPSDERSSVNPAHRRDTCAKCHTHATDKFASIISHKPHTVDEDFWSWLTALGFSLLTVGTIFMLALHVLADFVRTGHRALTKETSAHAAEGPIAADGQVPRFDLHMRIQHWGMMASFTTLVFTGWPLKAARVGISSGLVQFFGGQPVLAVIHRVAGAVLIAVSVYHLAYLIWLYRRGRLTLEMVPGIKDALDLWGNISYFVGLRAERPKFGRWAYYEKFDYWAVFWGMIIMGGTGIILWFPVLSSHILPAKIIGIAPIAHSDEALLAALAIFVWHFYNVHLRPTVFPMSWVWLTGKISGEALYEEHRGLYERLFGKKPPSPAKHPPAWVNQPLWSYLGLLVIVAVSVGVVAADVSSVREQIGELIAGEKAAPAVATAGRPVGQLSAFDAKFNAFDRCFACHNRERHEQGGAGFPHKKHFEEIGVDAKCDECHKAKWHASMTLETRVCMDCHKAEEIGLRRSK